MVARLKKFAKIQSRITVKLKTNWSHKIFQTYYYSYNIKLNKGYLFAAHTLQLSDLMDFYFLNFFLLTHLIWNFY